MYVRAIRQDELSNSEGETMQRWPGDRIASKTVEKHVNNLATHDLELGAVVFALKICRTLSLWDEKYEHSKAFHGSRSPNDARIRKNTLAQRDEEERHFLLCKLACLRALRLKGTSETSGFLQQPEISEWKWEKINDETLDRDGDSHPTYGKLLSEVLGTRLDIGSVLPPQIAVRGTIEDGLGVQLENYVEKRRKPLEFQVGGPRITLRCSPMEGVSDCEKLKARRNSLVKVRWNSLQEAEYIRSKDQFGRTIPSLFSEPVPSQICLGVDLEPDEWIKDSGCSKHMMGNRKLFSTYKAYNGGNVIFGSNLRGNIIGKCTISNDSLKIDNVEHVDNLGFNLLSIGQICDNKCRVTFSEHDSEITKDGKVIGRGIRKKGLYVMKLGNKPKDQICLATIDDNSTLWHRRLGHANMRLIQSLA
ncbi:retrovirus-related pol polyprotein from transposon TNT 1-94 [Tanacetum coccineum]